MEISNAYRNRWRRTWRSRAAVTGAGVIGIVAGAGAIAATNPASSGAATSTPKAVTPTAPRTVPGDDLERYLFGDDDHAPRGIDPDGDNWTGGRGWHDDDDDDGGWQPQQVTPQQQWQTPQQQWQPQPQTQTRGS